MRIPVAEPRRQSENTIALINVVFLLLLFFVVAGTITAQDERAVEPPQSALAERDAAADGVLVIRADGALTYRGESVDAAGLAELRYSQAPLVVRADRELDARAMLRVLSELKREGFTDVSLVALRGSGDGTR